MSTRKNLHLVLGGGLLGKALARQLTDRYPDAWVAIISGLRHTAGDTFEAALMGGAVSNAIACGWDSTKYSTQGALTVWIAGGRVGGAYANLRFSHEFAVDNLTYYLAALRLVKELLALGYSRSFSTTVVGFGSTCQLAQSPSGLDAASALDVGLTDLHPGNRGYALAKNAAMAILLEHHEQFDRVVWLNPPNLIGAEDPALISNEGNGHVVPGMIHRHFRNAVYTDAFPAKHPGCAYYRRDFSSADHAAVMAIELVHRNRRSIVFDSRGRPLVDPDGSDVSAFVDNLPPQFPGVLFSTLDSEIAWHLNNLVGTLGSAYSGRVVVPLGFMAGDATGAPASKRTRYSEAAEAAREWGLAVFRPLTKIIDDMVRAYHLSHPNWYRNEPTN